LDADRRQRAGQFCQPGLVVDADQRPLDRNSRHFLTLFITGRPAYRLTLFAAAWSASRGPTRTVLPWTDHPSRTILPTVSTSSARSVTLIRSCSEAASSSSRTGTAAWAITGPGPAAARPTKVGLPV